MIIPFVIALVVIYHLAVYMVLYHALRAHGVTITRELLVKILADTVRGLTFLPKRRAP